jgi:hypothetical protein
VKINSSRFKNSDKIEVIKRFAVSGRWCTIVDNDNDQKYKVMKTGKPLM